uniref:Uncharacterized protein n=1 Tax=Glossina palpalis gambiensis TaxID=67801 RepID=A0A1B0AM80_9MUSC
MSSDESRKCQPQIYNLLQRFDRQLFINIKILIHMSECICRFCKNPLHGKDGNLKSNSLFIPTEKGNMQPLSDDERRRYFPMNAKHHFTRNKFYFLKDLTFNHHLPVYERGFVNPKVAKTDREQQSTAHLLLEEHFESDREIDSQYENRRRERQFECNEGNHEKENIDTATNGTGGKKIKEGFPHERLTPHAILKGISCPAGHSKENIIKGEAIHKNRGTNR